MRSPKFAFSVPSLASCVSRANVEQAWRRKVKPQLRKQLLWDPIEFRDLDTGIKQLAAQIEAEVAKAEYKVSKPQTYLLEKSRGLCRQMMLVRPHDLILLQCLSTKLYQQIVSSAPSKAAFFEPGDMKWSTGKMTIGEGDYGSIASWKRFQKQVLKFRNENKFVVVTDVANFYDFINFKHLRNIIASICDVDETLLDLLIHLLNELAWVPDYMPRQEMGMPQIETEAPRVLANAMLFELDKVIEKRSHLNYARFMDDIDFGANSIVEAKRAVRDIDLTLQSRQLRLNSAKTKILTRQAAYAHFCVRENAILDRYARFMELSLAFPALKARTGKSILSLYDRWLDRTSSGRPSDNSVFVRGNGSKVHKRVLTLLRKCDVEPPLKDLVSLIKYDPGMRQPALRHLLHTKQPNTAFSLILPILLGGTFVDDLAHIEFANFCVHGRLKRTAKLLAGVGQAMSYLTEQGKVGMYSSLLIRSKVGTPAEILDYAKQIYPVWRSDYWLGRAVAGVYPRVFGGAKAVGAEFHRLIMSSNNQAAENVLNYHYALMNDPAFVKQSLSYLRHDNQTFPLRLYFPKALQILSVSYNSKAAADYAAIKAKHPSLAADPFFSTWGF